MKPTTSLVAAAVWMSCRSGVTSRLRVTASCSVSGTMVICAARSVNLGEVLPWASEVGAWPRAMTLPPSSRKSPILRRVLQGDAIGGGQYERLVVNVERVDGFGVDEVDVVAGGEDGADEFGGDEAG